MTEISNWLHASFYDQQARIGSGAFSNVYRARIKSKENSFVAIKIMDLEHISSSFEDILQEVQTMKMCDDPNILRCYCSFVNADQLWLVTEMMDKGSCLRVMNVARGLGMGDGMSEEWLAYILREALQGLHYLHNNGQIHRDIKPGNILVDSHGSVRLAGEHYSNLILTLRLSLKDLIREQCRLRSIWLDGKLRTEEGYRKDIWYVL